MTRETPESAPDPGKERRRKRGKPSKTWRAAAAVVRWISANVFGVFFALLVFLALPLLQAIIEAKKQRLEVREAPSIPPPPPSVIEDEEPPEEEPEPEEPPPMESNPEPMSLSDLALSLDPAGGGGSGAAVLNRALAQAVADRAGDIFSMSDLDQKPRPVYQVAPEYPSQLQRQKVTGSVKVEVVVDATGRVRNPRVVQSSNKLFEAPALEAVKQWRFEPGARDGQKVPFKIRIPFRFGA